MKRYRIATIPGDGIGKEVVPAGQRLMAAVAKGMKPGIMRLKEGPTDQYELMVA